MWMTRTREMLRRVARPFRRDYPAVLTLREMGVGACRFLVSNDVERYRVADLGGEREFVKAMLSEIGPGDVFFDCGACVGVITILAAGKGARVVAFEPDPAFRGRLKENLHLNHLEDVQVVEWALSDATEEATLFSDGLGGNSPSLRSAGERGMAVSVTTGTLDSAVLSGKLPYPTVLKLDVEGAEVAALRGMRRLLASPRAPRVVFLETHPEFLPQFGADEREALDILASSGYVEVFHRPRQREVHYFFRRSGGRSAWSR
jgi:FkbM family methyltransferase